MRDESDEDLSVKNCSYLVSRDSLFHFLYVKCQLELSWFILLQISTAAVVWLIRNSRFCPCHLSKFMIFWDILSIIWYYFWNKNHSWWYFSALISSQVCISCSSLEEVLHCFLIKQWSGKYWCLLTDLWPPNILLRRKAEVMLSHGLFSLLTERLMLHSGQFSMTTYNVLFEVSPQPTYTLQACASGLNWSS